jgi:hypothetical protein
MAKQTTAIDEPTDNGCQLTPTAALPGSKAKVAVMASRVERGEPIHHADDARLGDFRRVAG